MCKSEVPRCFLLVNVRKGMQSSSEQPLVGEERCVTTLTTAVKEANVGWVAWFSFLFQEVFLRVKNQLFFSLNPTSFGTFHFFSDTLPLPWWMSRFLTPHFLVGTLWSFCWSLWKRIPTSCLLRVLIHREGGVGIKIERPLQLLILL